MRADAGDTTTVYGEPLWGTRKGMRARLLRQKERNETTRCLAHTLRACASSVAVVSRA